MSSESPTGLVVEHVSWEDPRAQALQELLAREMYARYSPRASADPEQAALVTQALSVDPADVVATVLVTVSDGAPVAHGGLRMLRGDWEVKRVVVTDGQRGRGVGRLLMSELESIARAGGAGRLILQTGDLQPDAIALYERLGYTPIPVYEPYVEAIPFSVCFEKVLV